MPTLVVRTVDEAGAPIAGCELLLQHGEACESADMLTSDAAGHATFAAAPPGAHRLWAYHTTRQLAALDVARAADAEVVVALGAPIGRTLRVEIAGATAAQLARVQCLITLEPTRRPSAVGFWSWSGAPDERGVFERAGLPTDEPLRVRIAAPGMQVTPRWPVIAPCTRPGRVVCSITLRERAQRIVRGRVVDERGGPVAGATVRAAGVPHAPTRTTTDAEGRFALATTLADGETLRLWLDGTTRRFDSPTSPRHGNARYGHLHEVTMPCDGELEIPSIALDGLAGSAP